VFFCTLRSSFVKFLAVKDFLSKEEIAERKSRYADRIKAVLMLNSGYPAATVAECLLLDEKTVRKYLKRYLEGGLEGLCIDWHRGRESSLSIEQEDALIAELR